MTVACTDCKNKVRNTETSITAAFLAVVWILHEPISGLIGSTFIAKTIAVIVTFKPFNWMLACLGF